MRSKIRILTLALFVIIIAVTVGVLASKVSNQNDKPSLAKTTSTIPDSHLLPTLRSELEAKYTFLSTAAIDTSNDLGYPISGHSFNLVLPANNNNSLSFADKNSINETLVFDQLNSTANFMQSYFRNSGYINLDTSDSSSFMSDSLYYQNSSQVCQVTIYSLLDVTCDAKSQLESIATSAEPLVQAYRSGSSDTDSVTVSPPMIQSSKTAGYQVATMNILNSSGQVKAYFYTLNNSLWTMVNSNWYNDPHEDGDIMPNCEDFESDVNVERAFVGFSCYDSANRVTTTIKS